MANQWNIVRQMICNIEARPRMYVTELNYSNLRHLLRGYFFAIEDSIGLNINSNLNLWLMRYIGHESSLYWDGYIYHIMADGDEEIAINLLFKLLKKFAEQMQEENTDKPFGQ